MISSPYFSSDGTHVIPIANIKCRNCDLYEKAIGKIRWHPSKGASFFIVFPHLNSTTIDRYFKYPVQKGGAGSSQKFSTDPDWFAYTNDGNEVKLFGTLPEKESNIAFGNCGITSKVTISGKAAFVSVVLPHDNKLALWHETKNDTRFCSFGFETLNWPDKEDVEFVYEGNTIRTVRCSMLLSNKQNIQLVAGGPKQNNYKLRRCWLVYNDQKSMNDLYYSKEVEVAKSFLSFINGYESHFLWKDIFYTDHLMRVYYGWRKIDLTRNFVQRPLPLDGTRNGKEVVASLPALFEKFTKVYPSYNLDWIMSPLWYAMDSYLDDKLALACISLERLSAEHKKAIKSQINKEKRAVLWKKIQIKKVRNSLQKTLKTATSENNMSEEAFKFLEKKINDIGSLPNIDQLTAVFRDVDIKITDKEKEVIGKRNKCLHGVRTYEQCKDSNDSNEEMIRFDILRMLIHKAVLCLMHYKGPYIDYAERPEKGNFPVKLLKEHYKDDEDTKLRKNIFLRVLSWLLQKR